MARNNELVPIKCRQADNFGTDYECTELVDAKTRAEAAERRIEQILDALAHAKVCAVCAEGSWSDCEAGREGLAFLEGGK